MEQFRSLFVNQKSVFVNVLRVYGGGAPPTTEQQYTNFDSFCLKFVVF